MTTIQFVDRQQQPIPDATVAIASAPYETTDIGMITDDQGTVSLNIKQSGAFTFTIFYNSQAHNVSSAIKPDDDLVTFVV